jgi:hypothetical protein
LLGDNLAAHLSPVVIELCKKHNVRFIFLPENSTHLLQPLDVAVFGPMKRRWREVLARWKEECVRDGRNFATIPKQVITKCTSIVPSQPIPIGYRYRTGTGTYEKNLAKKCPVLGGTVSISSDLLVPIK